eukprot:751430-Hanusia_phi.AAC.3
MQGAVRRPEGSYRCKISIGRQTMVDAQQAFASSANSPSSPPPLLLLLLLLLFLLCRSPERCPAFLEIRTVSCFYMSGQSGDAEHNFEVRWK